MRARRKVQAHLGGHAGDVDADQAGGSVTSTLDLAHRPAVLWSNLFENRREKR